MASAKQLAARRKFARIMKSGGFKKKKTKSGSRSTSKPKRKTATKRRITKTIKRRSAPRKTMARRTITRRVSRKGRGIGSSLKTGVIGDVVKGIGAGSLVSLVMSRVAPNSSITPIASTGAAFLTGGIVGGAANLILSGGLSLGGIFGGGASAPVQEMSV